MSLTILEGSTFCICDELGDVRGGLGGLYAHDTRFLSTLTLTINGARPLLLSSGRVEYFSAAFYSRNPLAGGLEQDALSIARHRFVGVGLQDHVVIRNETRAPLSFAVELDFGTDFADIISVKQHDFALGDPMHAPELPPPAEAHFDERAGRVVLEEGEGRRRPRPGRAVTHRKRPCRSRSLPGLARAPRVVGRAHRRRRLARRRGGASRAHRAQVRHGEGSRP